MSSSLTRIVSVASVIVLLASACGGDDSATTDASSTSAEVAKPASRSTTATTEVPTGTEPVATAATTIDEAPPSTPASDEMVVLAPGSAPIGLREGEVVRFATENAIFEITGQDGWVAFVTPLDVWLTGADTWQIWVSIAHLKDARPDLGESGADRSGMAVPADPLMSLAKTALPDGTPILENFRPLPDDWFAYIRSLPGLTLGEVSALSIGGIDGEGATYTVGDVPDAPDAVCANGSMSWAQLGGWWCFTENESGTLLVAEIGGARYEVNIGATDSAATADRDALDAIVASLRVV